MRRASASSRRWTSTSSTTRRSAAFRDEDFARFVDKRLGRIRTQFDAAPHRDCQGLQRARHHRCQPRRRDACPCRRGDRKRRTPCGIPDELRCRRGVARAWHERADGRAEHRARQVAFRQYRRPRSRRARACSTCSPPTTCRSACCMRPSFSPTRSRAIIAAEGDRHGHGNAGPHRQPQRSRPDRDRPARRSRPRSSAIEGVPVTRSVWREGRRVA